MERHHQPQTLLKVTLDTRTGQEIFLANDSEEVVLVLLTQFLAEYHGLETNERLVYQVVRFLNRRIDNTDRRILFKVAGRGRTENVVRRSQVVSLICEKFKNRIQNKLQIW